ncbi:MAG: hypothetical protein ACTSYY_12880 [Promethearchaeota archaeon]
MMLLIIIALFAGFFFGVIGMGILGSSKTGELYDRIYELEYKNRELKKRLDGGEIEIYHDIVNEVGDLTIEKNIIKTGLDREKILKLSGADFIKINGKIFQGKKANILDHLRENSDLFKNIFDEKDFEKGIE